MSSRIVFCSNRKTANLWTQALFAAARQQRLDNAPRRQATLAKPR